MRIDQQTVAVVTGAASGIGRALALRLGAAGARLALADLDSSGLAETSQALARFNLKVTTHVVDVAEPDQMQAFAIEVERAHGKVSILINNAGVGLLGTIEESSLADLKWLMGINYWGVVHGVKFFLPLLRREPQAYIVNLSSVFGIISPVGQGAYASSKFAVRGFTEVLRHELEETNVRVAVVHPGGIRTQIAANSKLAEQADPTLLERSVAAFDRVSRTSPEAAAERIVRGIRRDEGRILVGPDAKLIDWVQRLLPASYWKLMRGQFKKEFGLISQAPAETTRPEQVISGKLD